MRENSVKNYMGGNLDRSGDVCIKVFNRYSLFDREFVNRIVDFYDCNWRGCSDFMHIPAKEDVFKNIKDNRVYIADFCDEIVGISTLKKYSSSEPWYQNGGNSFYNLTGVLSKCDNKQRGINGIGASLYESMISDAIEESVDRDAISLAVANYRRMEYVADYKNYMDAISYIKSSGADIIAEIDCRNQNSMRAFAKACRELNMRSAIVGVYTCKDDNGIMTEAPTFIVKVMGPSRGISSINELDYSSVAESFSSTYNVSEINDNLLKYLCNSGIIPCNCEFSSNENIDYYGINPVYFGPNICIKNTCSNVDISNVKLRNRVRKDG